ncbi:MAG: hypothetical protein ACPGFC_06525 [Paracoccaceae bacterium]
MLQALVQQSIPAGIGGFVGTLVGVWWSQRAGQPQKLLGGSVWLTALAVAAAAFAVVMTVNALRRGLL